MRDPELVARAQRAATRLESAREQWRALQPQDIAAELVGWNQSELPSQRPEQFASWPPGMPTGADQPPAGA